MAIKSKDDSLDTLTAEVNPRDAGRQPYVVKACGISVDFSRQRVSAEILSSLARLADERNLLASHRKMAAGEIVNTSEGRAALHMSLRAFSPKAPHFEEVSAERSRLYEFARRVRCGEWRGCRGHRIKSVINIGIGGSAVGPQCVWHALRPAVSDIDIHFLSAVDGVLLERILSSCEAKSTLVIVSSKSFTTRETNVNADAVDQWLLENGIVGADRAKHIVVVSANPKAAEIFGLPEENLFKFWNWVGGRFSVWGAIGLPVLIGLGEEIFTEFLRGAEEMDRHSLSAPVLENLPALLALLEYRNAVELDVGSLCVLPYDERLNMIVPWLQQLEMESLGKSSDIDGKPITHRTGLPVWGGNGDEAQHSFGQWLREGTGSTAIDVIWPEIPGHRFAPHYRCLVSNAKAQCEALVTRPCASDKFNVLTALTLDALVPRRIGALMALYEHKTTMLATLFDVNAFDQPGVEYGKKLSREVEREVVSERRHEECSAV